MSIQNIGVIGAGQMGNGIAHVFAQAGFSVLMQDISDAFAAKGVATIDKNLQRGVDKGKMTAEEKTAVLGRVRTTTKLEDLATCDIVIEAATEKWEVKKQIFETLDKVCKPGAILASNTSSISITKLAAVTKRPEAFIGMHFMNPVPVMQLIEVIRGLATGDATFDAVMELSKKLGKTPIHCNDFPGFVSNRVLLPMINEAIYALYEGVASRGEHRRHHEARHEPSDGTAHPGGFHRAGHLPLHPQRAARGPRRSQVPPLSPAHQIRGCRLARQEERARLLRLQQGLT